jgi:hypothetical protein
MNITNNKFQRNYKLRAEGWDDAKKQIQPFNFSYPTTIEFHIDKSMQSLSAQSASLRIFNLSQDTRKALYKDWNVNIGLYSKRMVSFMAGYGDTLSQVLYGNIKEAKSFRDEGSPNYITEIDVLDWSFAMVNSKSEWTMNSPKYALPLNRSTVVKRLVEDLVKNTGVTEGAIDYKGLDVGGPVWSRAYTPFPANTWDCLKNETTEHCFIDNGVVHCLLDDSCIAGDSFRIDSSSGLLSTPKKSGSFLKLEIMFEPSIQLGQLIHLVSSSEPYYSGDYRVIGVSHSGIISGAVGGKYKTFLTLDTATLTWREIAKARAAS